MTFFACEMICMNSFFMNFIGYYGNFSFRHEPLFF